MTSVLGNIFLDMSPQVRETKMKMNIWDYIKLKNFFTLKKTINQTKRSPNELGMIFTSSISDKGLVTKIYKELRKLNVKKPKQPD